jgi:general secretion pathway protein M
MKSPRTIALALLAGVLVVLLMVIFLPPYWLSNYYQQEQQRLEKQYVSMQRMALQKGRFEDALKRLNQQQNKTVWSLKSRSSIPAVAELQDIVRKLIDRQGGVLISTRGLSEVSRKTTGTRWQAVSISVDMRGSLQDMQSVFYAIEYGRPLLFLDQVTLRRGRQREGLEASLTARFQVIGWFFQ